MRRLMVRLMFSMFLAATPGIAHAQAVAGSSTAGGATSGTAGGTVGGATVSTSGGARGAAVEPVSIIAAGLGLAGAAVVRRLRR